MDRYRGRVSGPLLDRIDLHVEVARADAGAIVHDGPGEATAPVRERVARARQVQADRFRGLPVRDNASLAGRLLRSHCAATPDATSLLEHAIRRLALSARAHDRILRVARTLADLAGEGVIDTERLAEAIGYRALDRPVGERG